MRNPELGRGQRTGRKWKANGAGEFSRRTHDNELDGICSSRDADKEDGRLKNRAGSRFYSPRLEQGNLGNWTLGVGETDGSE